MTQPYQPVANSSYLVGIPLSCRSKASDIITLFQRHFDALDLSRTLFIKDGIPLYDILKNLVMINVIIKRKYFVGDKRINPFVAI
jgi:hypothetical protein